MLRPPRSSFLPPPFLPRFQHTLLGFRIKRHASKRSSIGKCVEYIHSEKGGTEWVGVDVKKYLHKNVVIIITWADPLCECIDPGISHTSLVLTQSNTSHQRRPTCRRTELRKPNNLYDMGTVQKREEDESVHRDYWPGRKRSFHPNNSAMETAEGGFGDGGYLLMIAKFEPELWQCSTVEFGLFSYFVIRLIWTLLNRILLCNFSFRNLIGFMLEFFVIA